MFTANLEDIVVAIDDNDEIENEVEAKEIKFQLDSLNDLWNYL